jgi:acyl-CoA thioesterase FadM
LTQRPDLTRALLQSSNNRAPSTQDLTKPMYPFVRLAKEILKQRNAAPLGLFDTHVSTHLCWPWDLDPWIELNNGRTLTLFDLGRMPMGLRMGLPPVMRQNGWGLAVAGASVRYRQRIKVFDRLTMHSRCVGWDDRFLYMDQSLWKGDTCASQALIRSAVTSAQGIVQPARLARALGHDGPGPALPDWVADWSKADATRPWPPQRLA